MRLVIHDHCGYLGQVHLSRQLARREHQVEHQYYVSYTTGRGAIQLRDGDPESLLMIGRVMYYEPSLFRLFRARHPSTVLNLWRAQEHRSEP